MKDVPKKGLHLYTKGVVEPMEPLLVPIPENITPRIPEIMTGSASRRNHV